MIRAVLVVALLACGGEPAAPGPAPMPVPDEGPLIRGERRAEEIASYRIRARYDAAEKRIRASERLTWINRGRTPVSRMPLHLYMNAFKSRSTLFWRESRGEMRGATAGDDDDGFGWIRLDRIVAGGRPIELGSLRYPGPDETLVEVPLPRMVGPGDSIELDIDFEVKLPLVFARTGYRGDFAMVGQWFPKVGVRTGAPIERWHAEPFHANSEFFADFGSYDVTLTVPETHVVAATGLLAEATANPDRTRTLRYRASDVHDFAWMAAPRMKTISANARTALGDVEVRVYFREPQRRFAERHLAAGVATIESLSRRLFPYPYPVLTIISPPPEAMLGAGGMEYPTLVTTAGDLAVSMDGVYFPEFVTVHEVGHQWFQGMLASNEVEEAWLDEGVNEYIDCLVMNELYGAGRSQIDALGITGDCFLLRRAMLSPMTRHLVDPIVTPSYAFATGEVYGAATYQKTALALRTIDNLVGNDAFARALQVYARRFAFRHPTGRDFFATLETELGRDLDVIVEPAFYGRGVIDLAVVDAGCDRRGRLHRCEIVVSNRGDIPVPFVAELELADGTRRRRELDPAGHPGHHRITVDLESPVVGVTLDPDNLLLLDQGGLDGRWRSSVRLGPATRIAARTQHWTQLLLGWVGL